MKTQGDFNVSAQSKTKEAVTGTYLVVKHFLNAHALYGFIA